MIDLIARMHSHVLTGDMNFPSVGIPAVSLSPVASSIPVVPAGQDALDDFAWCLS